MAGRRARQRACDPAGFVASFTGWVRDHLDTHLPFLAEVDGSPAGMAWLMLADRVPAPGLSRRRTGDVQAVYVRHELRDHGVGAALPAGLLREATAQGLEHVTAHSSERAVSFYRRNGYTDRHTWLEWRPARAAGPV